MATHATGYNHPLSEPLDSQSRKKGPAVHEVEVSILGPGFGECVVVHVGQGQWIIVDSCYADDGITPAALEYFGHIGVDANTAVSHIIVSHTDNDHIGGLKSLFSACGAAELVCSSAFAERDVLAWIATYATVDPTELARASTEINAVLEELPNRTHVYPHWAVQDRPIFSNAICSLTALSPNNARITQFVASLAAQLPQAGDPRRRVSEPTPNQASVALLLETPAVTAILGADLEEVPGKAWTHILGNSIAYGKAKPALLLKVPHHGSKNADCPAIWKGLENAPIAILATYNKGGKLPTKDDCLRILSRTQIAYSSSSFKKMTIKKNHEVDKVLKMVDVKRNRRFPASGHIRTRFANGAAPVIELFGNAVPLGQVH